VLLALDDCIQGVVELLAPEAYEKGVDIAWSTDPSLPSVLLGDEVRVRQIVTNLVGNAIKFTDNGGVLVTVARSQAPKPPLQAGEVGIDVAVRDTGIGIAPDAMHALFAEFEQAAAAGHRRQGGTGLGLAISRRLTRAMGGDIQVESLLGGGSTFTAQMRFQRADEPVRADGGPLHARGELQRVLLVLERKMERSALRLSLEGAGILVRESTIAGAEGAMAEAAGAQAPITAVIIDGHCGCATTAQLLLNAKAAAAPNPVRGIVVLDTAAKADFGHFRDAGLEAYLLRPVRPRSMLALLAGRQPGDEAANCGVVRPRLSLSADRTAPLSVLLVEDNDINALLARHVLERAGCEVQICVNGCEAVDAIRRVLAGGERGYDLVLMDAHLPVLDGLEATKQIKALYALHQGPPVQPPPIIAVTADAFDEDRIRCSAAGMDDYLAKPFDGDELLKLIDRWCRRKRDAA
jgi:CheY-like chemotaxis protein